MRFIEHLAIPGEHPIILQGQAGPLEGVLTVPETVQHAVVAFLGHPHSLQGGTMQNKVVTTMARAFKELGIPSLRFNFRGVGGSAGSYDHGIGESEDMLALVREWQKEQSNVGFIFSGFSFGSYVAYRAAAQCKQAILITIAPSVHHYNYKEFSLEPKPWLIIQGDKDEIVPFSKVLDFAEQFSPKLPVITFEDTGHFFHGKLLALKKELMDFVVKQVHC